MLLLLALLVFSFSFDYVVCVPVSFCAHDLGLLSCKRHGGRALVTMSSSLTLIPLVAGVPFTLGVLQPASALSTVPTFSGASPTSTRVIGGYLSIAGIPPKASVVFGLEPLSVFGTSPCTAGAEDPGGVTL